MKRINLLCALVVINFYCNSMELSSLANALNQLATQLTLLQTQLENLLMPPSLPNLGNTCYMNSVIQALYALPPLTNVLLNKDRFYLPESLGKSYVELINGFRAGLYLKQLQAFAKQTDTLMQVSSPMCGSGAQQDSEEFLTQLLASLVSSINNQLNDYINNLFETFIQPLYYCPLLKRTYAAQIEINNQLILPLFDPNTGQLLPNNLTDILAAFFIPEKNVTYSPAELEIRQQVENDFLKIYIRDTVTGNEQLIVSLKRGFRQNLADIIKTVKEQYIQQQCTKILYLTKLPPILIIALKRYDIDQRRALQSYAMQINVPAQLDIAAITPAVDGVDESQVPQSDQGSYELVAALVHLGGLAGGHYVAYVKKGTSWYLCNDQQITKVTEQQTLEAIKKGYVYIYKKLGIDAEIAQEQEKVEKSLITAQGTVKTGKNRYIKRCSYPSRRPYASLRTPQDERPYNKINPYPFVVRSEASRTIRTFN